MSADDRASETYRELRKLAFEDPLGAKRRFIEILEGDEPTLRQVLGLASGSGDGRVRQVIARAVQKRSDKGKIATILAGWRVSETDEFALMAISDALAGPSGAKRRLRFHDELPDLDSTFRYLSARLRHRVLNILPRAGVSVSKLHDEIRRVGGEELCSLILPMLDDLLTSLRRLERAVDFPEEEAHFALSRILLPGWFTEHAARYQRQFGPVVLRGDFSECAGDAWIYASSYLLDIVFTNLWNNSQQAVSGPCEIMIRGIVLADKLEVQLVDNGPGLSSSDVPRAFRFQYSSKGGEERGRGHMEAQDAMRRLGGEACVRQISGLGYRVVLTFPRSKA